MILQYLVFSRHISFSKTLQEKPVRTLLNLMLDIDSRYINATWNINTGFAQASNILEFGGLA